MTMPILTTSEDALSTIAYLKNKSNAVTLNEAKAALGNSLLDGRKISAYKYWLLLKDTQDDLLELSDFGRQIGRKPGEQYRIFKEIIRNIPSYFSVLEWCYYQKINELSNIDTIVHWREYSPEEVSSEERTSNYQSACFFRFCEGAALGEMRIGRKGKPTRFIIDPDALNELIQNGAVDNHKESTPDNIPSQQPPHQHASLQNTNVIPDKINRNPSIDETPSLETVKTTTHSEELYKRVYITHGKNVALIETLKRILEYGELEPVVSIQSPSVSKPIPEKIMDEMRSCGGAIIHVDDEKTLFDDEDKEIVFLNQNVLIEIGAALALYGKRLILLVKEGVKLPSNLQGLFEVRYSGDKLDSEITMELLDAINKLKQEKIPD